MKKNILLGLVIITVIAAALRLYRLGDYPALNADEAALGYNAYSLIETGKDEHGNPWPISFQSFNDYKPGLYVYLDIPFIYLLGLNVWAVRLPGVLAGIASVLVLYLLVKEFSEYHLFNNHQQPTTNPDLFALLSAFFLAVSSWHIHFSRGAWEVNVANFFLLLGIWLFLVAVRKSKNYFLSFVFFVLALYTYHASRLIVPLMLFVLMINFRTKILKAKGSFLKSVLLSGLILIPLAINIMGPAGISRVAGVGLFADPGPINRIEEERGEHNSNSLISKIIHNKLVNYGLSFVNNYTEHFYGEFLFLNGDDIQRDKVPETGVLYLLDFIFLLTSLIVVAKRPKNWSIIFFWLIITPIPAALTFQSPHALRAFAMNTPLIIFSAYGAYCLIQLLLKMKTNKKIIPFSYLMLFFIVTVFSWNVLRYLHEYYVHMAKDYPYSSQYGIKNLVTYLNNETPKDKSIIITDRYDQPYILFLFYLQYPPLKFQKEHQLTTRDNFGFSTVRQFDRYRFTSVNFDQVKKDYPNSIIAGTDSEIPDSANVVKKIFENNFLYFKVVDN
jgi:4-amino-4-deoxy-L-arabinose transferase-like glycosyltransferase